MQSASMRCRSRSMASLSRTTSTAHKELEALQKGGVQRIYTGNVATGEHQLEVSVIGKLAGGKDYSATERFNFSKGVEPKLLGITLSGPSGKAAIEIGDW